MKRQLVTMAFLSLFSLSASSQGLYVFGGLDRNKIEADAGNFNISSSDNGYALGAGYGFGDIYAVELGYRDIFSSSVDEIYEDYEYKESSDVSALQISLLAQYPLNEKVSVFGRLGVGRIDIDSSTYENSWGEISRESSSDSKTKALFGIGARYAITEKVGVRAEYSRFAKIEDTTLSSLSLAVDYHF